MYGNTVLFNEPSVSGFDMSNRQLSFEEVVGLPSNLGAGTWDRNNKKRQKWRAASLVGDNKQTPLFSTTKIQAWIFY